MTDEAAEPMEVEAAPDLQKQLLDILTTAIEGKLDIDQLLTDVTALGTPADVSEALANVFWLLWIRLEGAARNSQRLKLVEIVRECLAAKKLDRRAALDVLDPELMQVAGIISDVPGWTKILVRVNTKMYFTQRKFNLLREDSEGYARLIVVLNHFGEAALTEGSAGALFHEVRALIGYFELDPNRVLDLVLEAAEQQQVYRPTDGSSSSSTMVVAAAGYLSLVPLFKADAVMQLLGFRFQQYQTKPGEGELLSPPHSLFLLCAALVAAGHVTLEQVLGQLMPSDEAVRVAQAAAVKALVVEVGRIGLHSLAGGGGGTNALAAVQNLDSSAAAGAASAAAALATRRPGLSAADLQLDAGAVFERALVPSVGGQQVQLLSLAEAMLQIKCWPLAVSLLERLSLLGVDAAAHPPISMALCEMLADEVAPILAAIHPHGILGRSIFALVREKSHESVAPGPPLSEHAVTVLKHLGMFLYRHARLQTQIIRVLRHELIFHATVEPTAGADAQAAAEARRVTLESLVLRVVLPSMMLRPTNPALVSEVWQLLLQFPYGKRFEFYADLKDLTDTVPLLTAAAKLALSETKKVLRRVVLPPDKRERKEACKPFARLLAKVCHANPLAVIEALVSQVEAYPNLTDAVLEALKFMVPLSFDVLTFVVLQHLAAERPKVKDDGINPSSWLQNLAQFVGQVCRKHAAVELTSLLQFLTTELRYEDSYSLLVLSQIIQQMTGVTVVHDLGDKQLEATAGGPILQQEVIYASDNVDKGQRQWRSGNKRLYESLTQGTRQQHLLLPLLLLMAQHRAVIMTRVPAQNIKSVVALYDHCQETLLKYIEWVQRALSDAEYAELLPSLRSLRTDYGLEPDIVFHIYRPMLGKLLAATVDREMAAMAEDGEIQEDEEAGAAAASADGAAVGATDGAAGKAAKSATEAGDTAMEEGEQPPEAAAAVGAVADGASGGSGKAKSQKAVKGDGGSAGKAAKPGPAATAAAAEKPVEVAGMTWPDVLTVVEAMMPPEALKALSAELYATFWSLSLYDIYLPAKRYDELIEMHERDLRGFERMPRFQTEEMETAWRKDKTARQDNLSAIRSELAAQKAHVDAVHARIRARQALYLTHLTGNRKDMACWFTLECLLPRCLLTPSDALYCARFIELMHQHSSVWTYNAVLANMVAVLTQCSDREASNMGVFLLEVLRVLSYWRSSEKIYDEECKNSSGFYLCNSDIDSGPVVYDMYKKLTTRWFQGKHPSLHSVFKNCLASSEYVSLRNGLTVLNIIVEVFPAVDRIAEDLRKSAVQLQQTDERDDLKIMARSYAAAIMVQMNRPGRMMTVEQYGGQGPNKRTAKGKPGAAGGGAPAAGGGAQQKAATAAAPSATGSPMRGAPTAAANKRPATAAAAAAEGQAAAPEGTSAGGAERAAKKVSRAGHGERDAEAAEGGGSPAGQRHDPGEAGGSRGGGSNSPGRSAGAGPSQAAAAAAVPQPSRMRREAEEGEAVAAAAAAAPSTRGKREADNGDAIGAAGKRARTEGGEPAGREPVGREPAGRERELAGREPVGREPAGRGPAGRPPRAESADARQRTDGQAEGHQQQRLDNNNGGGAAGGARDVSSSRHEQTTRPRHTSRDGGTPHNTQGGTATERGGTARSAMSPSVPRSAPHTPPRSRPSTPPRNGGGAAAAAAAGAGGAATAANNGRDDARAQGGTARGGGAGAGREERPLERVRDDVGRGRGQPDEPRRDAGAEEGRRKPMAPPERPQQQQQQLAGRERNANGQEGGGRDRAPSARDQPLPEGRNGQQPAPATTAVARGGQQEPRGNGQDAHGERDTVPPAGNAGGVVAMVASGARRGAPASASAGAAAGAAGGSATAVEPLQLQPKAAAATGPERPKNRLELKEERLAAEKRARLQQEQQDSAAVKDAAQAARPPTAERAAQRPREVDEPAPSARQRAREGEEPAAARPAQRPREVEETAPSARQRLQEGEESVPPSARQRSSKSSPRDAPPADVPLSGKGVSGSGGDRERDREIRKAEKRAAAAAAAAAADDDDAAGADGRDAGEGPRRDGAGGSERPEKSSSRHGHRHKRKAEAALGRQEAAAAAAAAAPAVAATAAAEAAPSHAAAQHHQVEDLREILNSRRGGGGGGGGGHHDVGQDGGGGSGGGGDAVQDGGAGDGGRARESARRGRHRDDGGNDEKHGHGRRKKQ